jgi:hypothetical protein
MSLSLITLALVLRNIGLHTVLSKRRAAPLRPPREI